MDRHLKQRPAGPGLRFTRPGLWLAIAAMASPGFADADNFGRIYYDKQSDTLVVTMIYRGTNPNHHFSLRWGDCQPDQVGNRPGVTVEVLDDQFDDVAEQEYRTVKRFSLLGLPCRRPASVTLRTAPRFFYTLLIPKMKT